MKLSTMIDREDVGVLRTKKHGGATDEQRNVREGVG